MEKRKKSLLDTKIFNCVYLCYGIMALWVAYTFPLDLILDLFWGKVDRAMILEKEDHDGVLERFDYGNSCLFFERQMMVGLVSKESAE